MQKVNVDRGEYHTVFQMFDKSNTGEISIKDVTSVIQELDETQKASALAAPPPGLKEDKLVGATGAYLSSKAAKGRNPTPHAADE